MLNLYCIILTVYLRKLSVATSSYLVLETYKLQKDKIYFCDGVFILINYSKSVPHIVFIAIIFVNTEQY